MINYIFTGRFQPLHNGHIAFLEKAKSIIPKNSLLIICIIRNSNYTFDKNNNSQFHKESIIKQQRKNNPLPNWERYMLVKLAIDSNPIIKENTIILFRDRSDTNWEKSLIDLPKERIFLFPKNVYTEFDRQKRLYYEEKNEHILDVINNDHNISATDIRKQLIKNPSDLSFLPKECRDYFNKYCISYFLED